MTSNCARPFIIAAFCGLQQGLVPWPFSLALTVLWARGNAPLKASGPQSQRLICPAAKVKSGRPWRSGSWAISSLAAASSIFTAETCDLCSTAWRSWQTNFRPRRRTPGDKEIEIDFLRHFYQIKTWSFPFCRTVLGILSSLLEPRFDPVWHDLEPEARSVTAKKFMDVTETLALAMARNVGSFRTSNGHEVTTPYICKFIS